MKKQAKLLKIINIVLILSMILRICFFIAHLNANCIHHDDCPICKIINHFNKDLTGYKPNNAIIVIGLFMVYIPIIISYCKLFNSKKNCTPVGLNVELLN